MLSIEDALTLSRIILTRYVLSICLVLGILGNVLNIGVFLQKKLRWNPCSIYFIAASIVNLLIIAFGVIPTIATTYVVDTSLSISWLCKLKLYGLHALLMMSRSYVVMACIDRFALCSPSARLRQFNSHQVALRIVPIVPLVWLLVPTHMLIFVDIQIPSRCGTSGTYSLVYTTYSFVCSTLPLLLMIVFSLLALRNLRKVQRRVMPVKENQNLANNSRIKKHDYQLMVLLICEVIVYIISSGLHPVNTLYLALATVPPGGAPKSSIRLAVENFMTFLVWGFLIYLNSCVTFYVNLCISKPFRNNCYQMLLFIFMRRKYEQQQFGIGTNILPMITVTKNRMVTTLGKTTVMH